MHSANVAEDCLTFAVQARVLDLVAVGIAGHGNCYGATEARREEEREQQRIVAQMDGFAVGASLR